MHDDAGERTEQSKFVGCLFMCPIGDLLKYRVFAVISELKFEITYCTINILIFCFLCETLINKSVSVFLEYDRE